MAPHLVEFILFIFVTAISNGQNTFCFWNRAGVLGWENDGNTNPEPAYFYRTYATTQNYLNGIYIIYIRYINVSY